MYKEMYKEKKLYKMSNKVINRFKTLNNIGCLVKSFKTKDDIFEIFNLELKKIL